VRRARKLPEYRWDPVLGVIPTSQHAAMPAIDINDLDGKLYEKIKAQLMHGLLYGFPKIPPRPDLKEPPNRKWLGLYKVLPPPPEYFPPRRFRDLEESSQ
jgi:hypothetical protein